MRKETPPLKASEIGPFGYYGPLKIKCFDPFLGVLSLTIGIVTLNMQHAGIISDHTGLLHMDERLQFLDTQTIFTVQTDHRTEDDITG